MQGGLLTILFVAGCPGPDIAVAVRRMHDIDKSGWLVLIGLIPAARLALSAVLYAQPGTSGPNRFGPDPKGAGDAQIFA